MANRSGVVTDLAPSGVLAPQSVPPRTEPRPLHEDQTARFGILWDNFGNP